MQRDHAWHSARHLEDLDDRRRHRPPSRRARGRPAQSDAAEARQISGDLRPARLVEPARPFRGGDQRRVGRAQDELPRRTSSASRCSAPGVTIVDDPLRLRGLRSRPFDGEGVRVSRQELVSGGILNQWIADSAAARQLGIAPTGHAARGVGGAPGASPSNLYMEAGQRAPARNCSPAFPKRCWSSS